jgi:hypothetical protein
VGPRSSVFVPVAFVGGVAAPVVDVVDMVAMGHAHVPASLTVLMRMVAVLPVAAGLAFIGVFRVRSVQVSIVGVVDVVRMGHGHVTAPETVRMIVVGVLMMLGHCHW